jgi:hypothetical protein
VKAPVGVAEAEVVDETEVSTVEVVDLLDVAEAEELVDITVPFLIYKESRLPAPVFWISKMHGEWENE